MLFPLVFVDADVLHSTTLRGWLFNLSAEMPGSYSPAFELLVTEDVIAEAVATWRDRNPRADGGVTTRMAENLRSLATIVRDYDCSIPFPGKDEGDIHVHAAALACRAGYLVTNDGGFHDLPEDVKDSLPYEIYKPDDFLVLAAAQSPSRIREATRATMLRYAAQDGQRSQMVAKLRAAGCPEFATIVDEHLAVLAGAREPSFPSPANRAERRR